MAKQLDIGSIVDKYKELKRRSGGSADFLKLADGETRVRVIPYENEFGEMAVMNEFSQHVIAKKFYTCPKTFGKPCVICDAADLMWERGEREVAKELNSKSRFMFWVLFNGKLQVMEVGTSVAKGVMKYFADEDYQHFTDLNSGHDLKIMKSGSGMDTEYDVIIAPKPSAVKLSENPKDLGTLVKGALSTNELKAVLLSHYSIEEVSAYSAEEVAEDAEEVETEEELKERLKAEARERLAAQNKAKAKPAVSTVKKPVRK